MKYIFRYSLLSCFTNSQPPSIDQLKEALREAKFPVEKHNLEKLIDDNKKCIQKLIMNLDRQEPQNVIKEWSEKANFPNVDAGELSNIWEVEKHLIYKKMIAENSYSVQQFNGIQWSIRTNVLGKNGLHDTSPILSMKIKTQDKNGQITFELARNEMQSMSQKLAKADELLNHLFSS